MNEECRARAEVLKFHDSKPVVILSTRCYDANDKLLMDGSAAVMVPQELYDASKKAAAAATDGGKK